MTDEKGLLKYLGETLREEREARDVILAEIVAVLHRNGSNTRSDGKLSRFEHGITTPRDLDQVVSGYAEVLEINPLALWAKALERARDQDRPGELEQEIRAGARSPRKAAAQSATGGRASGRKRRAGGAG